MGYQVTCAPSLSALPHTICLFREWGFWKTALTDLRRLMPVSKRGLPSSRLACLKCVIPGGHIGSLCHSRVCVTGGYLFLSSSYKTSVACMTPWFYCQIYWLSLMLWILFIKVSHYCESSHDLAQAGRAGVSTLGHLLRLHSVQLCVISMGAAPNSLTLGSTQLSSLC